MIDKKRSSNYGLLLFSIVIYSCCSLCSKFASGYPFLSFDFLIFYGLSIFILGVYAVLWQLVLKKYELTVAYANKPISMLLSMVWGGLLFHETISWNMVLGAGIILLGIRMVVKDNGH